VNCEQPDSPDSDDVFLFLDKLVEAALVKSALDELLACDEEVLQLLRSRA
jgi:hypothetical protein